MNVQMTRCNKCGKYHNGATMSSCPYCEGEGFSYSGPTEPLRATGVTTPMKSDIPEQIDPVDSFAISNKTVPVSSVQLGMDPIVGWLVGITGDSTGTDYRIKYGQNSVGRGEGNDICIYGDDTISRDNQAKLVCDKKSQRFYIVNGDGRSVNYINGEIVLSQQEIHAYDIIEIGSTQLVFVPLCGEHFSWESMLREVPHDENN